MPPREARASLLAVARRPTLRASDADRDRIAERLREAAAEGRLLAHELEQRLGVALRARTYGELDAVVSDLPAKHRSSSPVPWIRPVMAVAIAIATLAVLALAALIITGLLAAWLVWVAIGWFFFGRRSRRHCAAYGRRSRRQYAAYR